VGHVEKVYKSQDLQENVKIVEQWIRGETIFYNIMSQPTNLDGGCRNHMTHDRENFKELNKLDIFKVRIENGEQLVTKDTITILK